MSVGFCQNPPDGNAALFLGSPDVDDDTDPAVDTDAGWDLVVEAWVRDWEVAEPAAENAYRML